MPINNLQDWRYALFHAQHTQDKSDPFWSKDHLSASRAMRGGESGIVGAMMVEELWKFMGPLEHAWLERFAPDCRQKYPQETEWVTPWNADIAVNHYGLAPTFNYRLLSSMGYDNRIASLARVAPAWLKLRNDAGLLTDCWQLTHEIVQSFHSSDHLPQHERPSYSTNVNAQAMARLQLLCPSQDWPLALACAGVNALELNEAAKAGQPGSARENAVAWLQWWLKKSPDCLDNLAWADFPKPQHYTPQPTAATQLHLDLLEHAQDARDTFPLARILYSHPGMEPETFLLPGSIL